MDNIAHIHFKLGKFTRSLLAYYSVTAYYTKNSPRHCKI